jgi:hypothetical protein
MRFLLLPIFSLFIFNGCECNCTLMACSEGIAVSIKTDKGESFVQSLKVKVAYGDTTQLAAYFMKTDSAYLFNVESPRLRNSKPESATIEITKGAEVIYGSNAHTLKWVEHVCNHCSGDKAGCSDQMATTAKTDISI